jgi:hypothetical protein
MEFLGDVGPDKTFYFKNGGKARNLYELVQGITELDEENFRFHCNLDHDDFANWVGGILGDITLSQNLRFIKEKKSYLKIINKHIFRLEKQSKKKYINKQFSSKVKELLEDYGHIWLIIFVMIMTSVFTAMIYFQYNSLQNINILNEKINYIESRNTCYNNFFGEQTLKTRELLQNASFDNYCIYNLSLTINPPDKILEEKPAFFTDDDIKLEDGILTIDIGESYIAYFDDSSSMLPTLNHHTKAIEVTPRKDELYIGDIISYNSGEGRIIHRIVDIGSDKEGIYYITKGDNNAAIDDKVRYEQIRGKVVVMIY